MSRNKVYVILGGTGGIGSAVARQLDANGATVVLAAREGARLEALSAELGRAPFHRVDATDINAVDALIKTIHTNHGRVDGIVNCVGSILLKAAHQTSEEHGCHR